MQVSNRYITIKKEKMLQLIKSTLLEKGFEDLKP